MNKDILRIFHDLYLTTCYLILVHTGYNLVDKIRYADSGYFLIPLWIFAAIMVFMHTKETYEKEKKEAED